jgi:hypothetical protein
MMCTNSRAPAVDREAHWLAILDTYQVQFLILDAQQDRALLDAARRHPAWTVDYDDGDTVLLTHPPYRSVP